MDWNKIEEHLDGLPEAEAHERHKVLREAATWLGTPYHENGDIKGAGVDCGMILVRVFADTGIIESFDPRPYPTQWAFNQRAERYLQLILHFAKEIEGPPLPADVALLKVGHSWSHGMIITVWPDVIHANPPGICREDNCKRTLNLMRHTPRFFRALRWFKDV